MNFDLDDDQREFAAAAKLEKDGGAPQPGFAALQLIGFPAITVPESAGGAGRGVLDLAVVAEQGGRVLAGPSLVTPARAAVLLGGEADRLTALADGTASYAVVDGTSPTLDAAWAETFLSRDGDDLLCGPGTVVVGRPIDATRGLGTVTLEEPTRLALPPGTWERALRVGRVVLAAEDLGTAARAVEIGVAYALEREAFGRPIGSYQAVKHSLVNAYVGVEQLRSLVWWAAWAADESPEELPLAAAAARAAAARVLEQAAETLIQVHGGIGFTWEHDAHLFWRRAKVDRLLLGDATAALDEVAHLVLEGSNA
jgi:alkylation response protein AidB-like acyl-CoA dehydrogenase